MWLERCQAQTCGAESKGWDFILGHWGPLGGL